MSSSLSFLHGRGKASFIVTTTTFFLATLFVAARIISRFAILKHRTADDWIIILAWFLAFGLSFAIDFGTSKGLGERDEEIPEAWMPSLRASEYAFTILYNPTLMATKTSILIFYLRLSKNTQKILRIASFVTLAVVNVAGVVLTFINAFQCSPVKAAYDPAQNDDRCISIVTLYLCSAPVNIITDLAILVLPIPVLTGMRLPQRQKTILVITFGLGIFVTIVDVIRIYYLQQASSVQAALSQFERLGATLDFAYNASTAFMWSAVEVNVGIICACIPTLKPLVKQILPAMLRDLSKTQTEKTASLSSQINVTPTHQESSSAEPIFGLQAFDFGEPTHDEAGAGQEAGMSIMDFLAPPGTGPNLFHSPTRQTQATDNTVYFGFVSMRRPRSMLKTQGMESFKYCLTVTILFFLWGFSYGLLNSLNNTISTIANQSLSQTIGLTAAYFGAYLVGSLTVGLWVLRRGGFKATFIAGLCIYGTGTLMFWPCAVLTSFPGFIISNFVVGFGLSVLETAANPFLALCGPSEFMELRLLLAQGVQAVGTVLSQLIGEKVLFVGFSGKPSLIDVQWTYLAIALFDVVLALFFYYMPLPEALDEDLQAQSENQGVYPSDTVFSKFRLIYATLGLAVFAQFCYVAAQESMSVFVTDVFISVSTGSSTLSPSNYVLVGHTTFAIGRFLFAGLCIFIQPRILLMATFVGCIIFATLTMVLSLNTNGIAGPALMFFFFEGPIWPIVYAIGLRGLGRSTKLGAACLTAAASGGAGFPFAMLVIQEMDHKTIQYSYCVIIALLSFGAVYPLYLNLVPKARRQVHAHKGGQSESERDRPETPIRRLSKRFSVIAKSFGVGKNDKGDSLELPIVEHRESRRKDVSVPEAT